METSKLQLFLEKTTYPVPHDKEAYDMVMEKFGIFAGNSTQSYTPVNVANDVIPKEEDFVMIPFRLLSSTVVAAGTWRSTFFPEKVLKSSAKLLEGQPVYVNHDTDDVNNAVGVVVSVKFTQAFKAPDGTEIPAGLDGMLKLDAKSNPKLARLLLMTPPAINSVSVTVLFEWEPSHEMSEDFMFENQLGMMIDGKMVTRNATKITGYFELSLVWLGADPFAKMLDADGNPIRVDKSSVYEGKFGKDLYENEHRYFAEFSLSSEKNLSLLSSDNKQQENNTGMKLTLAKLLEKLGVSKEEDLSIEGMTLTKTEDFTALQSKAGKVEQLEADKTQLTTDLQASKEKVTEHETTIQTLTSDKKTAEDDRDSFKAKHEEQLTAQRTEATRLYKLGVETPSDVILELINKAEGEQLAGLTKEYKATAKTRLGRSVDLDNEDEPDANVEGNTINDIYDRYNKPSFSLGVK